MYNYMKVPSVLVRMAIYSGFLGPFAVHYAVEKLISLSVI